MSFKIDDVMIESEFLNSMFQSALTAALESGKSVMKIYNNDESYNVNLKSDNTLVIEADRVSHETIRKVLSKTRIPLMSEEGRDILFEERYGWELYWLVDPIDGTIEFVNKSNEFSICVALMEKNSPIVGVIVAPAFNQLYYAIKGVGSYRIDNIDFSEGAEYDIESLVSSAVKIECDMNPPQDRLKVLTTLSHPNKETEEIISTLRDKYETVDQRMYGSALKFCRIAEGGAHLYFRTTSLKDWDTAAGEIIAIESGLSISTLTTGSPLYYNKQDLTIEPFVVSCHPILTPNN